MITNKTHGIIQLFAWSLLLILNLSCEKKILNADALADGIYIVTEIEGVDERLDSSFGLLPTSHISFNVCTDKMNKEWGTNKETHGVCQMLISNHVNEFTQDEYRFHIINDNMLKIKRLNEFSDKTLPDLTGSYTYSLDDRDLVLKYKGNERTELENLEIFCWDWQPK